MVTTNRKKESVTAPPRKIKVYGAQVEFPYGEVQRMHTIAEYTIVEYRRYVVRDVVADENPRFRVFVRTNMICDPAGGVDYHNVDEALCAAVAFKYQHFNSEAPLYFMRMIGAHNPAP